MASSNSIPGGRAGVVPVAITIRSACTVRTPPCMSDTSTVWGSVRRPCPGSTRMWFRASWFRITSTSRAITCWVRQMRSSIVISSFTR